MMMMSLCKIEFIHRLLMVMMGIRIMLVTNGWTRDSEDVDNDEGDY